METRSLLSGVKPLRWGGAQMELAFKVAPGVHRKRDTRKTGILENGRKKAKFIPIFSWARDFVTVRR
jgi:hypothetical protein